MSQPLLSILIPTVVGREEQLGFLLRKIRGRFGWREVGSEGDKYDIHYAECISLPISFGVYKDDKSVPIGEKREDMYRDAQGLYVWQVDDDDSIADNAIQLILEAIKQEPDCITFRERCIIDGVYKASNFSLKYEKWEDNVDGYAWVRTPFYKCVIKTSIAQSVPFPHIRYNEDEQWANALRPHLQSEVHIDEELYYYIHNSTPHHERYGFDKD